jgi:hypothetical protein
VGKLLFMTKKELREQVLELEDRAQDPRAVDEIQPLLARARQELNEWRVIGGYMPGIRTVEWCRNRSHAHTVASAMKKAWPQHVVIRDPKGESTWV